MANVSIVIRLGISIHAAREGGDSSRVRSTDSYIISIHAAREGGDQARARLPLLLSISIHAAREGGDLLSIFYTLMVKSFQSTPPVKAATIAVYRHMPHMMISIHAAREGGDIFHNYYSYIILYFNPRRP